MCRGTPYPVQGAARASWGANEFIGAHAADLFTYGAWILWSRWPAIFNLGYNTSDADVIDALKDTVSNTAAPAIYYSENVPHFITNYMDTFLQIAGCASRYFMTALSTIKWIPWGRSKDHEMLGKTLLEYESPMPQENRNGLEACCTSEKSQI